MLNFDVKYQTITKADDTRLVSHAQSYPEAVFNFITDDWKGKTKTALFTRVGTSTTYKVVLSGDKCIIPYEVLSAGAGQIKVSVFGGSLMTTNTVTVDVYQSGYTSGTAPGDPTPTVYEQITSKLSSIEIEQTALRANVTANTNNIATNIGNIATNTNNISEINKYHKEQKRAGFLPYAFFDHNGEINMRRDNKVETNANSKSTISGTTLTLNCSNVTSYGLGQKLTLVESGYYSFVFNVASFGNGTTIRAVIYDLDNNETPVAKATAEELGITKIVAYLNASHSYMFGWYVIGGEAPCGAQINNIKIEKLSMLSNRTLSDKMRVLRAVETYGNIFTKVTIDNTSNTYVNSYGWYTTMNNRVYFIASIKVKQAFETYLNNAIQLPDPTSAEEFELYDPEGYETIGKLKYVDGSGWRLYGDYIVNSLRTIYGYYIKK